MLDGFFLDMSLNRRGVVVFVLLLALQWKSTNGFAAGQSAALLFAVRRLTTPPTTTYRRETHALSRHRDASPLVTNGHRRVSRTRSFISLGDEDDDQIIAAASSSSLSSSFDGKAKNRRDPQWQERSHQLVMLVDDDEALRQSVEIFLDQQGFQVTTFSSAETALQFLEDNDPKQRLPNLIVSDIRMPGGMDGLEFLQLLRQNPDWIGLPVVLLTAKGQTRDRIAGYNAGADGYLPKPFDSTELVSLLDSLLARQKRIVNAPAITLQDLQKQVADIQALLQKGGAGPGVNGFVQATNVFLAPDERQTLELLCQGLPNKEIAAQTFLSTRRVEQLLTTLYRKTGVTNRTELVRWAIRTGNVRL